VSAQERSAPSVGCVSPVDALGAVALVNGQMCWKMSHLFSLLLGVAAVCGPACAFGLDIPKPGRFSRVQVGGPQGELTKKVFDSSKAFPGTTRDYWLYVPRQYNGEKPANLVDRTSVG